MAKTYRHPETRDIKTVDGKNEVQEAALKKLGYVEITAQDIENEPGLSVTYQQVTRAQVPVEPPPLPHLTTPVPPGPTRDTSAPAPATPGAITRDDVEGTAPAKDEDAPLGKGDKK